MDSPRSRSSGVTAVAAAILAGITGLLAAATTIFSIVVVADIATDEPSSNSSDWNTFGPIVAGLFVLIGAAAGILALLHLLGALLLFLRKTTGRVLVIIASTLGVALALFGLAQDLNIGTFAAVALCGTTLVYAALPATGRWIAEGKLPPHPCGG
ncbi:hypothetical protein IU449_03600 [Nocardia higoensis]|uniref:Uncharacterized protein n=1 Tax=Nocardia higoensis TaxID=228599 RepID=A0ABS0D7L1_9NOCA|nr:hypothetical protein [Nocardia higoensis]MBF6353642.1 hypothetical protein [Nocardia higoensis]